MRVLLAICAVLIVLCMANVAAAGPLLVLVGGFTLLALFGLIGRSTVRWYLGFHSNMKRNGIR